jgi:hypothetical protein
LKVRDTTASAGDDEVGVYIDGNGNTYWYNLVNSAVVDSGGPETAGVYVRIARVGNVFTLYKSADRSSWTQKAQYTRNDFAATVDLGINGFGTSGHTNYSTVEDFLGTYSSATSTTTALASNTNPASAGVNVTFTATVTGSAPTGNVAFLDGAATIATVALNGSYQAAYSTSALSVGTHSITAVYAGDTYNSTSTSSPVSQVINSNNVPVGSSVGTLVLSGLANATSTGIGVMANDGTLALSGQAHVSVSNNQNIGTLVSSGLANVSVSYAQVCDPSVLSLTASANAGYLYIIDTAAVSLQPLSMSATLGVLASVSLQPLSVDAAILVGNTATTTESVSLQPLSISATLGVLASVSLQPLSVDAIVYIGSAMSSSVALQPLSVNAGILVETLLTASASLQPLQCAATVSMVKNIAAYGTLYPLSLSASVLTGLAISSSSGTLWDNIQIALQPLKVMGTIVTDINITAAMALAPLQCYVELPITIYNCYVINTMNNALTTFTNMEFNSICEIEGEYYAASANGLYKINNGDKDNGNPVNMEVQTGVIDLSLPQQTYPASTVNTPREIWLNGRFGDAMMVTLIERETDSYEYPVLNFKSDGIQQLRVKFGRGINRGKDSYFAFNIQNVDGGKVDLKDIKIKVQPMPQRTR